VVDRASVNVLVGAFQAAVTLDALYGADCKLLYLAALAYIYPMPFQE
jgi:hypothetical protein